MIEIYRKINNNEETLVAGLPEDNATLERSLMGADEVALSVTVSEPLDLRVGDYARLGGSTYTINRTPDLVKASAVEYRYDMVLESPLYNLLDKIYISNIQGLSRFPLSGDLNDFVELLLMNINRDDFDPGWTWATDEEDHPVTVETERKSLSFDNSTCRDVLNRLADEFGVEYVVRDRTIAFHERVERVTSLVFEQGQGKGLYTLQRQNVDTDNTVTRAYVYGSTENLPYKYREGLVDRLCPRERGTDEYIPCFENREEYPKLVEREVYFDDVKPTFTGNVDVIGEDGVTLTCGDIDFNLRDVVVGKEGRVNFLTGDMMGKAFNFNCGEGLVQTLTLIRQEDETGKPDEDGKRPMIPNATWRVRVGDKFTFTGITLPDAYIRTAEALLAEKGRKWIRAHSCLRVKYNLDVDYRYAREKGITFEPGDVVGIVVPGVDTVQKLRINSVKKQMGSGKVSCEVSNYLEESLEDALTAKIQEVKSSIDLDRSEMLYAINATREWTTRNFGRLSEQMTDGQAIAWDADGWQIKTVAQVPDAVKWEGHHFGDYLNQFLLTTSDVEFASILTKILTTNEITTPNFVSGLLGSGARLKDNHLELDEITVRKRMNVFQLIIQKVMHQGGILILSPGGAEITSVVDGGTYYKCTFDTKNGKLKQPFAVDDQLLSQSFDEGNTKRYWRRVTSVGEDYFNLSKADCEANSAIPATGDEVVVLGNRTNVTRQSAMILCTVGADAPYMDTYDGINSFSLDGKLCTREGNLSGIVDEVFGQLDGTGLYAKNVYLRGKFALSTGITVEDKFGQTDSKLSSVEGQLNTQQGVISDLKTEMSAVPGKIEQSVSGVINWTKEEIANSVAKTVTVTAPVQVFKYAAGYTGTPNPSNIVLSVIVKNFTPASFQWQFLNGSWTNIPGATGATYSVTPGNTTLFPSGETVRSFRCVCDGDEKLSDVFTLAKLADGATGGTGATGKAGEDACTVLLTNEAHTIACDASGTPLAGELAKATTKVVAYKGSSEVSFVLQNLVSVGGTFVLDGTDGVKCTALSSDSGGCTFEVKIGSVIVKKVFGVTKSKTGQKGDTGNTGGKGDKGDAGAAGKGVQSVVPQYYLSTSSTTQTGGSWSTAVPAWTSGKYIWTRFVTTYTDNSTTTTAPVYDIVNKAVDVAYSKVEAGINNLATGITIFAKQTDFNSLDTRVGKAETQLKILPNEASLVVTKDNIISQINLCPGIATIEAKKIDLFGKVTFAMFATDAKNTIDGKVTSAQATTIATTQVNTLKNSLGTLAYLTKVEQAQLGTTIIEGGYVKASLIRADLILSNGAQIGNFKIGAVSGTSGNWLTVNDGSMGLSSAALSFVKSDRTVRIGSHPNETVGGEPILGYFNIGNVGITLKSNEKCAIYASTTGESTAYGRVYAFYSDGGDVKVNNGYIMGRHTPLECRLTGSNDTWLGINETTVFTNNTRSINVYLPWVGTGTPNGYCVTFIPAGRSANVVIQTQGSAKIVDFDRVAKSWAILTDKRLGAVATYSSNYNSWIVNTLEYSGISFGG